MTIKVGDCFKCPRDSVKMVYEVTATNGNKIQIKVQGATGMHQGSTGPFWISDTHQILDEDWRYDV